MTTPEKKVKDKVKKLLAEHGAYYFMPATGGYGKSGVFDIVACYKGRFIGIEVKADCTKKPTGLQSKNALLANAMGADVLLIHDQNIDALKHIFMEIDNEQTNRPDGECIWVFDSNTKSPS